MWEWLAGLDLEKAANAVVILLTGTLVAFGFRGGKRAPAGKTPDLAVATDFFDAHAIGMLTREVTGQAVSITAQGAAITGQTLALNRHTDALEKSTEENEELRHAINRVREAIDRLVLEMARRR